jgi:hypothetical protein
MLHNSSAFGGGYMKKSQKEFRANSCGQLLLVAALVIAILISSTTIYVYEVSREKNNQDFAPISDLVLAIKQSTRNTMISSLANASNGGAEMILTENLNELSQVLRSLNHFGTSHLAFAPLNDASYDDGIRLSWNTSDAGVSSVYSNFTLKIYCATENLTLNYALNVTTTITISGYYTQLGGNEKQVNLTCNVYNEAESALARNFTIFYDNLGNWTPIDSSNNLSTLDYGNGTYRISFTAPVPSDSVQVSVRAHDLREIFVRANTTCYES